MRVRARSPLEGSRPSRWWGRDSGLGTMQVPRVARGGSRLCFCRVVLRDAVERKLRGTHRLYYVKTSSYGMNALGMCLSIHRTALSALARSDSRFTSESTLSAGHPPIERSAALTRAGLRGLCFLSRHVSRTCGETDREERMRVHARPHTRTRVLHEYGTDCITCQSKRTDPRSRYPAEPAAARTKETKMTKMQAVPFQPNAQQHLHLPSSSSPR